MARIFQLRQLGARAPRRFGFGDKPLFHIKEMFFDRQGVKDALDSATYYYLSRQGGYIRKVARNSMRPVRGPSAPGTPPHRHVGFLWRLLFYAYDRSSRSVVAGPTAFGSRWSYDGVTVPELQEYGGTVHRQVTLKTKDHTGAVARTMVGEQELHFPARPYMGPALEAANKEDVQRRSWAEAWARTARRVAA